MSDLQIALGAIGILVVGGVYVFNWWQERRLRQRLERAFDGDRDDVLLKRADDKPGSGAPRIEPRLSAEAENGSAERDEIDGQDAATDVEEADPLLEFSAIIQSKKPYSAAALQELRSKIAVFGKPVRILLWDAATQSWYNAGHGGADAGCNRLLALVQLVDRGGPIHAAQLTGFCDAVQSWAEVQDAIVESADPASALQTASELDALCGELDVAIGLNVVAPEGSAFPGEQVAAAADEAGFELEADGRFYRRDDSGRTLFTMENHDPEPFAADRLATLQTPGMTLLLEVPHVANGEAALEEMARVSQMLAEALGGFVVDDNRVPLQAAGIDRIKTQLAGIQEAMAANEIMAGSPRAQRLFA
ncbi:MAG: cell division protein ZipA C-terminal FtsZ-binding domain-containing protein [Betaproteobacteria bacterium]|nr:cell division protein ZipA C-terminal FtsZ-binding domain-containing protein [Betaproteobacteria bacterium]